MLPIKKDIQTCEPDYLKSKFTGKHLRESLFLNKVATEACNLKRVSDTGAFL